MTLRFDWYPECNDELINSRAEIIIDNISKRNIKKSTIAKLKKTTNQILSALYFSYFSLPKGTISISIPLTSGHYSKTDYSYRMVKDVFECLSDLKWIEDKKGTEAGGKVTRIWAVGELSIAFEAMGLLWFPQKPNPRESLVFLRDRENPNATSARARKKKIDLPVPETPEVLKYRDNLYRYNQFLLKHRVSLNLDDQNLNSLVVEMSNRTEEDSEDWFSEETNKVVCLDVSRLQLRRIFSRGSLEQGGRFYGGFWQSIPERHRPHILIDGKKTIEIDFSTMSLRILYAQEGIEVPFDRDLYDIGLEGWIGEDDPRRKPIKKYINAVLNDETGNYRLSRDKQDILGISHRELHQRVLENHKPISHLFSSGIGLHTQFIDSEIAERVMLEMMYEGVLVLPIHDSFIIRVGYKTWLNEAMKRVFKELTGSKIGVSYSYVKLNEHFGKSNEEIDQLAEDPANSIVTLKEIIEELSRRERSMMDNYIESWEHARISLVGH